MRKHFLAISLVLLLAEWVQAAPSSYSIPLPADGTPVVDPSDHLGRILNPTVAPVLSADRSVSSHDGSPTVVEAIPTPTAFQAGLFLFSAVLAFRGLRWLRVV